MPVLFLNVYIHVCLTVCSYVSVCLRHLFGPSIFTHSLTQSLIPHSLSLLVFSSSTNSFILSYSLTHSLFLCMSVCLPLSLWYLNIYSHWFITYVLLYFWHLLFSCSIACKSPMQFCQQVYIHWCYMQPLNGNWLEIGFTWLSLFQSFCLSVLPAIHSILQSDCHLPRI